VPAERPLVSIVLPTHDGVRFLEEAVASCLGQSLRDLELLVVDDGSTDGTPALLERLAAGEPRLTVIRCAENRGLPAALNRGFAAARGAHLTWTSDDNRYRPEALARMTAFLREHPQADLVYADHTVRWEEEGREEPRRCEPPERLAEANVVGACFLFRRSLWDRIGRWDESLAGAEDYDYWLRARAAGARLAPLHEDLYVYRMHAASLTGRRQAEVRRAAFTTLSRHLPRLPDLRRRQRARGWLRLAELARDLGDLPSFRRCFLRALATAPSVPLRRGPSRRAPALNFVTFAFGLGATERLRRTRPRRR
jgi:glycosyltransferase involved in cell wall biosynthesis